MLDKILTRLDEFDNGIGEDLLNALYLRVRAYRIAKAGLDKRTSAALIWEAMCDDADEVVNAKLFGKAEMIKMLEDELMRPADIDEAIQLIDEVDNEDDEELRRVDAVVAETAEREKYMLDESY